MAVALDALSDRDCATSSARDRPPRRKPLVGVAIACGVGTILDRLTGLPWMALWAALVVLLLGWKVLLRLYAERTAALVLLAVWLCVGAARHHEAWSARTGDDISLFAADEARPLRLVGVVATQPTIRPRDDAEAFAAWPQFDISLCDLECRELGSGTKTLHVTGRARLRVTGHLLHAQVGDIVEVRGWLARPAPPANPGEFDYPDYLRRLGIQSIVYVEDPNAVRRLGRDHDWDARRAIADLRVWCHQVLQAQIGSQNTPVAAAMLFGDRSGLTEMVETAFAQSGTMHILAISGFNVAILVGFCWGIGRALNLSPIAMSVVLLTSVAGLVVVSDASPSVVRAGILATILILGRHGYRRADPVNSLAAAALLILLWRPTDLFDIGAQLSFLAVMGILWSRRIGRFDTDDALGIAADPPQERGPLRRRLNAAGRWLGRWTLMILGIAVWTSPLIMWAFHLVSPLGLVINLIAGMLAAVALCIGYSLLLAAALLPPVAGLIAPLFDATLGAFSALVDWSGGFRSGHVYVPRPPLWWLAVFYGMLVVGTAVRTLGPDRRRGWQLLCLWMVAGLSTGLVATRPPGLRCTFLSVGHGGAILLEFPNGRTLLYDAGAINDPRRAQQVVQRALWARGHFRIDALVISHADVDHMNAVPGLLRTVPVGQVLFARSFLAMEQPAVRAVCEAAAAEGIAPRIIWRGDRLLLDDAASVEILHPDLDDRDPLDNANSLVLDVSYAGRRILLTGDLEQAGLSRLLAEPPRRADVMLAPHHGSARPNSSELAAWARPRHVVASVGRDNVLPHLRRTYGTETVVWSTDESGAVTVVIGPDGSLAVEPFRTAF